MKHIWSEVVDGHVICKKCGYKRTFNPNIDYTGGNIPWPLTGYDRMELNESLYGECKEDNKK